MSCGLQMRLFRERNFIDFFIKLPVACVSRSYVKSLMGWGAWSAAPLFTYIIIQLLYFCLNISKNKKKKPFYLKH